MPWKKRTLLLLLCSIGTTAPLAADDNQGDPTEEIERKKAAELAEMKEREAKIKEELQLDVNALLGKVVLISTENEYGKASGSGCIVQMDDHAYVVTCKAPWRWAWVLAAQPLSSGRTPSPLKQDPGKDCPRERSNSPQPRTWSGCCWNRAMASPLRTRHRVAIRSAFSATAKAEA